MNTALLYKYIKEFWIESDHELMAIKDEYEDKNAQADTQGNRPIREEKRAQFEKVREEFENRPVILDRPPLDPNALSDVGLTPIEMLAIEPLLDKELMTAMV